MHDATLTVQNNARELLLAIAMFWCARCTHLPQSALSDLYADSSCYCAHV